MDIDGKGRTLVCGDIHGAHKALVQVLERCDFDYNNDTLITIGDIVDGWGDSFMVVEELLKIPNRVDIMGNHDSWFKEFIDKGIHSSGWTQGALATAKSYAKAVGIELNTYRVRNGLSSTNMNNLNSGDIPDSHKKFFRGQNRYYKDSDDNIFVHGGFDKNKRVQDNSLNYIIWDRGLWNKALSSNKNAKLKFYEDLNQIFIGHTTTLSWKTDKPMKADRIWNLDTGCGSKGKLTIMDVNTNEYWQSDNIPELYPNDEQNLYI